MLGIFSFGILTISLIFVPKSNFQSKSLVAPPAEIEHLTFGLQESVADGLWLRAIQDFDGCEVSDLGQACPPSKSWLYEMLNAITNLSPQFRTAYLSGALALGILVGDNVNAGKLYDKAVLAFPNDWQILYYAGYHFLYEIHDPIKAAGYLERAAENGAPSWVYSLAGRLYVEGGNPKLAQELLVKMIQSEKDPAVIRRMREKIESLDSN